MARWRAPEIICNSQEVVWHSPRMACEDACFNVAFTPSGICCLWVSRAVFRILSKAVERLIKAVAWAVDGSAAQKKQPVS